MMNYCYCYYYSDLMSKYLMMKDCFEHCRDLLHRRVMTLDHYWLRTHHCHYDGERRLYYYFFYVAAVELLRQQDLLPIAVVVAQLVQAKINYQRRNIYYYYYAFRHHVVYLFFHYYYYDSQKKNSISSIYYSFDLTTETAVEQSSLHPIDSSLAKNTTQFPVECIHEITKIESCAATEHTPSSIECRSGSS